MPARPTGLGKSQGNVNYFTGKDSSKWRRNVATYRQIGLGEIYPDIELVLEAHGNNVEKLLYLTGYTWSSDFPVTDGAYDENCGDKIFIATLTNDLGTLTVSTCLGGVGGMNSAFDLTLDSAGNIYITGYTDASGFPATSGAYDESFNGGSDVFVAKLSNNLSTLKASTFIGGKNSDHSAAMALDSNGNVHVVGYTTSYNFPVTNEAYEQHDVCYDAFITRMSNDLSTLDASTLLGGSHHDYAYTLALDSEGNIYLAGRTESSDFPVISGAYDESYNAYDVFIAKLELTSSSLTGQFPWMMFIPIIINNTER